MREVTHGATGPVVLDESDIHPEKGDIAICRCGLSDDGVHCDGSHRATEDETADARYKYVDGERREIDRLAFADEE